MPDEPTVEPRADDTTPTLRGAFRVCSICGRLRVSWDAAPPYRCDEDINDPPAGEE